jgi:surface antigen
MKSRLAIAMAACMAFIAMPSLGDPAFANHKAWHKPLGHAKPIVRYRDHGGPPPWAPAHGYRGNQKFKFRVGGHYYGVAPQELLVLPTVGLGNCNRETIGALLGGAAGGYAGYRLGDRDSRALATLGGAILGALVGGTIGRAMDQADQYCVGQVLEQATTGQRVVWENPDRGSRYEVTPTRTYETTGGQYCREYQTEIVIGGRVEHAYGTACRQPDGSWEKAN